MAHVLTSSSEAVKQLMTSSLPDVVDADDPLDVIPPSFVFVNWAAGLFIDNDGPSTATAIRDCAIVSAQLSRSALYSSAISVFPQ